MKIKNVLTIMFVVIFIIILINNNVYAASINTSGVNINNKLANQFDDMGSTFFSTIRIIAMIVSIGALMIMGIRYMTSSLEEKALQKESMIFYCIGAVLVFAIVTIVSAMYEWLSKLA